MIISKFQIIVIALFVVFIITGAILFATYKGSGTTDQIPTITIWGTIPKDTFTDFIQRLNTTRQSTLTVNYIEVSESNFRSRLIEELADGRGPDAILVSQQNIIGLSDKIIPIPSTLLTQRDFRDTFVSQAELYETNDGTLALPFMIDPLVMYWNRSIFTNVGIAQYPTYWDEFGAIIKKINNIDESSNIRRSTLALGEFQNINHAREILSALLLQAGNPITFNNDGTIESALGDSSYAGGKTSVPAVNFFTQFSNPRSTQYSWNRSLPSSKNAFLAGNLATYFGFASEANELRSKNPNLDFNIAPFPQIRTGKNRTTFGDLYGFSIVRSTADASVTYGILNLLTLPDATAILSESSRLPGVRRDMIAQGSSDASMALFLDGALISRGWLDMNPNRSNKIFTDMIESITSGRVDTDGAIRQAHDELNLSLSGQ